MTAAESNPRPRGARRSAAPRGESSALSIPHRAAKKRHTGSRPPHPLPARPGNAANIAKRNDRQPHPAILKTRDLSSRLAVFRECGAWPDSHEILHRSTLLSAKNRILDSVATASRLVLMRPHRNRAIPAIWTKGNICRRTTDGRPLAQSPSIRKF